MDKMDDKHLIREFKNGNEYAFNTLVWRWQKPIYNFILRYLGDRELSGDLMQQTFIRVYQNLRRLKNPERFSTWLFQIAVNLCRDEIKRKKRVIVPIEEQHNSDEDCGNSSVILADQDNSPETSIQKERISQLLMTALQELPENQRIVIIMKEYHGLKFTEIAQTLEEPLNTVKSRMYYGLTSLRKIFERWGINREDIRYEM